MNDPIVARAMIGTSPISSTRSLIPRSVSEMSAEELSAVPSALHNFDEARKRWKRVKSLREVILL